MKYAMKCGSKILGLLLTIAVVIAPSATGASAEVRHAAASLAGPGNPPAGCHMHASNNLPDSGIPNPPRPLPASYQCCLTGHDAAVVQTSYSPQPAAECIVVTAQIELALPLRSSGVEVPLLPSADPPCPTPLRI
jgi:hypothetical protein